MHLWLAPDPRPHNHPWHWIDCQVLRGFYTALEYIPDGYGDYIERELTLTAGDPVHRVKYQTHHQIVRVHPGTVTIMSFGPIVGDGKQWGHLVKDDDSFRYEPNSAPPQFVDALRHLNPHLRPVGWVDPFHHLPVPSLDEIMDSIGL